MGGAWRGGASAERSTWGASSAPTPAGTCARGSSPTAERAPSRDHPAGKRDLGADRCSAQAPTAVTQRPASLVPVHPRSAGGQREGRKVGWGSWEPEQAGRGGSWRAPCPPAAKMGGAWEGERGRGRGQETREGGWGAGRRAHAGVPSWRLPGVLQAPAPGLGTYCGHLCAEATARKHSHSNMPRAALYGNMGSGHLH